MWWDEEFFAKSNLLVFSRCRSFTGRLLFLAFVQVELSVTFRVLFVRMVHLRVAVVVILLKDVDLAQEAH